MLSYSGLSGRIYQLNNNLGEGGEGIVYDLVNDRKQVAKVYKSSHFKNQTERSITERKLKAMLSMKLSGYVNNMLLYTWPQDILYDNGMMVGFIMPKVHSNLKIFSIYRMGPDVKKIYPKFTWKYSVQFAYNLAWVVQHLHSHGIVVGDFNQNNIYVDTNNSAVVLVDCDSFDITDPNTGEHFPCTVGFSEVLAPELQVIGNLKNGRFTKETDNFSLAIHIFRLLMKNADPFGGIISSGPSTSSLPQNQAIVNGECQYVRDVGKTIPKWSPKLNAMPPEIQKLFDKTFNYTAISAFRSRTKRATAQEWCDALYPYAKAGFNRKLKTCTHDPLHVYASHNRKCPWCVCEGHDYDPEMEIIDRHINKVSTVMHWLLILSFLGVVGYLLFTIDNYQSAQRILLGNLQTIFDAFSRNANMNGLDIIRGNILRIISSFTAISIQYSLVTEKGNHFLTNNKILVSCSVEQFANVVTVIPIWLKQIKNIICMAKENLFSYFGGIFGKVKGLFHIEGR